MSVLAACTIVVVAAAAMVPHPARAQFVCAQAGTYPVDAGNVAVSGGGAIASGSNLNVACGGIASAVGAGSANTAIGAAAGAAGDNSLNTAAGFRSVADGANSKNTATGAEAFAAGDGSSNTANGWGAEASGNNSTNVATGSRADAHGSNSSNIAIGANATASGDNGRNTAIGANAVATGATATAVGANAQATFANSAAFGNGAQAARANQQVFGAAGNTYTMTGINSAQSRAAQTGPLSIVTTDGGGNLAGRTLAELGLASAGDITAINAQLSDVNNRLGTLTAEVRRGLAAMAALAPVIAPSAPGRTTLSFNSGFYRGEVGAGFGIAHRLHSWTPVVVHGSYSNGGGSEHVGRVGVAVEF